MGRCTSIAQPVRRRLPFVRRDVQLSGAVEPQEFGAVAFAEVRILELITEFHLDFAVGDAFDTAVLRHHGSQLGFNGHRRKISREWPSGRNEISFAPLKNFTTVLSWDNRASFKKIVQTDFQCFCNALNSIHGNVYLSALNVADIRRGKFCLFREFFLSEAIQLPIEADSFP